MTNAYRILDGKADGLSGVAVDKYNGHFQIQFFTEEFLELEAEIAADIKKRFKPEFLVVKYRFKNKPASSKVLLGNNSKTTVEENSLKFSVDLLDTMNPGLFLDMRDARHDFALLCAKKEVLNLFAYTCSFSVYARMHGALKTVNVDISKKNLSRGKENFELNGLSPLPGEFFCGSSEEYVNWALKKGRKFGAIVIDPPSFAKNGKKTFSVAKDFENLAVKAVSLLETNGVLLLATNYSEWSGETLQKIAVNAGCKVLKSGTQGKDFPGTGQSRENCMNYIICELP